MLDELIAEIAGPLKAKGFKHRGKALKAISSGNAKIIQFQTSEKSSDRQVVFTINLGVVCGELLDVERVDIQKSTIVDTHLRIRIGMLLESPGDHWWTLSESDSIESLTRELLDLLLVKAIPYLERHLNTEALITLWESGTSPGLTAIQRSRFLAALSAKRTGDLR